MTRRQWNSTLSAPKKPLARSGWIARGTAALARSPMKRKPCTPSEFARKFGSRARVKWVKSLPCVACVALHPLLTLGCGPSENAHTETGGMGYKAGYETIAPLCPSHHRRYDQHQAPFDTEVSRQAMKDAAVAVQARWVAMQEEA